MSATSNINYTHNYQKYYDSQEQQYQQEYYDIQQSFNIINSTVESLDILQEPQLQQYQIQPQEQFYQIQQPISIQNSVYATQNTHIPNEQYQSQVQHFQTNQQPRISNSTINSQPTNTNKSLIETTLISIKQEICQICSSQTSVGLHFGAITCEACKKFFIRSIKRNEFDSYVCKRNTNDCPITLESRACIRCRFDKCIKVGMNIKSKTFQKIIEQINLSFCVV